VLSEGVGAIALDAQSICSAEPDLGAEVEFSIMIIEIKEAE